MLEQGGIITGQSNITVTLLKNYSSTTYSILLTLSDPSQIGIFHCFGKSVSSFSTYHGSPTGSGTFTSGLVWRTTGYAE